MRALRLAVGILLAPIWLPIWLMVWIALQKQMYRARKASNTLTEKRR